MEEEIIVFAETNFRNQKQRFGIKLVDRRRHMYIVGKSGTGKSTLLENMAIQDIQDGRGVAVVDPHGEFVEKMLDFVPPNRLNDVVYFDPSDVDYPVAFNVIEKVEPEYRYLVAAGLMGVFKKIWPDVWSARMEYILNNTILALLEYPGATLLGINRMLADKDYRNKVLEKVSDPSIRSFWANEFAKYPDKFREEAVAPIQNKVGQFISSSLIRNIIGQTKTTVDLRDIMDKGKILLINLSKGKIGEDPSNLLGALWISKLQLAAMSRIDISESERKDFCLYVDEFQNFVTESFATILSEARKYRLNLVLAHQYIGQLVNDNNTRVRDAIFGNVGTMVTFRVGATDAEFLEKEFSPEFMLNDLVSLGFANIYLKLLIDGFASRPFSATTLPPIPRPEKSFKDKITKLSRERYGTPRQTVEERIAKWSEAVQVEQRIKEDAPGFETVCWECGQKIKVGFEPDGVRPVYCKDCLKKVMSVKSAGGIMPRPARPPMGNDQMPRPALSVGRDERGRSESHRSPASVPRRNEMQKPISLDEALKKEPVNFSKKKKAVDLGNLRETLNKALRKDE